MEKKTFIPNQNRQVLRMLAREFGNGTGEETEFL